MDHQTRSNAKALNNDVITSDQDADASPTLNLLPIAFKQETGWTFCEMISILLLGWTFNDLQPARWILAWTVHKAVKEMPFAAETARPGSELLLGC